jgi:hypothetical protein
MSAHYTATESADVKKPATVCGLISIQEHLRGIQTYLESDTTEKEVALESRLL